MALDLLGVTEQLYGARIFIIVMGVFNVLTSLLSIFFFKGSPYWFFSLISAVVFVFNVIFLLVSLRMQRRAVEPKEVSL